MRRYALIFPIVFAVILGGFAAFNALIDPYGVTGAPRLSGINAVKLPPWLLTRGRRLPEQA